MKILRLLDDVIIYRLNKSVPTTSFSDEISAGNKCKELYTEVYIIDNKREPSILNLLEFFHVAYKEIM